jgi:hypothetical protein
MTCQTERRAERDELRMPYREERIPMDAARSSQGRIGRHTRQAFVDQMFVGRATAKRAWIGPASIVVLRLDEHQRHRRLHSAWTHQMEVASEVQPAPLVANALHM